MHQQHVLIEILAHAMIAFLFIYRAIAAIPRFQHHREILEKRGVPAPALVLICGLAFMLGGGISVLLDLFSTIGAAMLIAFTIATNALYHNFWSMEERQKRQQHRNIFCNNLAVMGGLLLVIS